MNPRKTIICIAGPSAGGKTSVAEKLQKETGGFRVRASEILAELADELGVPKDKASLQNLYLRERETRGEHFVAEMLAERAQNAAQRYAIVDGLRRVTDIETFEKSCEGKDVALFFFFIDASPDIRFERYNARQTSLGEEPITREEFEVLESNAAENELTIVRDMIHERGHIISTDTLGKDGVYTEVKDVLNLNT